MKALSTIVAGNCDETALKTWLQENLGPGFLQDVPMEQHLAIFKQLCADIGTNTMETVEQFCQFNQRRGNCAGTSLKVGSNSWDPRLYVPRTGPGAHR